MAASSHTWRFARTSGLEQVKLETGADLAALPELDPALWVALACPAAGLEYDARTLALLDHDSDGRVRHPEILDAVRFCQARLGTLDGVARGGQPLPLASLSASPEGARARGSAAALLASLGRADATSLTVEDLVAGMERFAQGAHNGDGVVPVAAVADPALAQVATEALAAVGGVPDRSGAEGLNAEQLDAFWAALEAVSAWAAEAEADPDGLLPLGDGTSAAVAAVAAVEARVQDWFTRAQLAAYDPRAQAELSPQVAQYTALAAGTLRADAPELAAMPLAQITPGEPLPLGDAVHPAWRGAVQALVRDALTPILGPRESLSAEDWAAVQARLAPHRAWQSRKPDTAAHALGLERVRALLAGDSRAGLRACLDADAAEAPVYDALAELERLVRYHRDLRELLDNFVNFRALYDPDRLSVVQAGTLYLDSRACGLCVRVLDAGKHAAMANMSHCYLAYLDCHRAGQSMSVVAVFSGGDTDFLLAGRNGLFVDRKGQDWDATITRIVANPVSLREAFWSPYKRFIRLVESLVAGRAAAAEAGASAKVGAAAETTANADKGAAPAPKFDLGSIALIGVAVSGAAAVIGGLLQAFFGLGLWMPLGLVGLMLLISGPSMLIAALKLRQRNLGPLLDANGWAINGRVRLNIPFGGSLTRLAELPPGSERSLEDPYLQPRGPWRWIATVVVLVALAKGAVWVGYHRGWLPEGVESRLSVLGVPGHLTRARDAAAAAVEESRAAASSAQERLDAATRMQAELAANPEATLSRVQRANARVERAEARLGRAEDRLEKVEERLERATEALEAAVDAEEARAEAREAGAGK